MSLDALLTPDNPTDSASDGIDGGTGCNLSYFFILSNMPVILKLLYNGH